MNNSTPSQHNHGFSSIVIPFFGLDRELFGQRWLPECLQAAQARNWGDWFPPVLVRRRWCLPMRWLPQSDYRRSYPNPPFNSEYAYRGWMGTENTELRECYLFSFKYWGGGAMGMDRQTYTREQIPAASRPMAAIMRTNTSNTNSGTRNNWNIQNTNSCLQKYLNRFCKKLLPLTWTATSPQGRAACRWDSASWVKSYFPKHICSLLCCFCTYSIAKKGKRWH